MRFTRGRTAFGWLIFALFIHPDELPQKPHKLPNFWQYFGSRIGGLSSFVTPDGIFGKECDVLAMTG